MTALADAVEVQNELHELTMSLLRHHAALCRDERGIKTDDLERLLERARYADAALRRLRDMLGFAASAGRENEPRPVATSWAPTLGGGSGVINLDEWRRNRAERAR